MTHYSRRQVLRQTALGAAALFTRAIAEEVARPLAAAKPPPATARKKGVCGGIHGTQGLVALKPGWFYSWGVTNKIEPPPGVQWLPQIFPHTNEDIAKSCAIAKAAGHTTLLGYNEPDHPGQGNLSVAKALEGWPLLMATGMRLVSPAVTWAPNAWMKNFMRQADAAKLRIDAVAIHWYGMPNPDAFLSYVTNARKDYARPIWITEFGVNDKHATADKPSKITPKEVLRFLGVVLPALEKLPWVERYCLYGPHQPSNPKNGFSCLFADDGKLTEVGEYFASVP